MTKTTKRNRSQNLTTAKFMPPLYHTLPDEKYEHQKSEVLKWVSKNPFLLNYAFSHAKNAGFVFYNTNKGKWQGVDWEGDDK